MTTRDHETEREAQKSERLLKLSLLLALALMATLLALCMNNQMD